MREQALLMPAHALSRAICLVRLATRPPAPRTGIGLPSARAVSSFSFSCEFEICCERAKQTTHKYTINTNNHTLMYISVHVRVSVYYAIRKVCIYAIFTTSFETLRNDIEYTNIYIPIEPTAPSCASKRLNRTSPRRPPAPRRLAALR